MRSTEISIRRPVRCSRSVVASGWGTGYFPVALRLIGKELIAVIRGGAEHMGSGGRLDMVRSADGGITWSKRPRTIFDTPADDRNPALGQTSGGTIVLGFLTVTGYAKGYTPHKGTPDYKFRDYLVDVWIPDQAEQNSYYILSKDGGRSWSEPNSLEVPGFTVSPFGRIIELKDRTLLMNVYGSKLGDPPERSHSFVMRSEDEGETWGRPTEIAIGLNETSLLLLPDDRIMAALRSDEPEEATYVATSSDDGTSWTKPRRVTKNLEHPADLALLGDGRILMVYGHRNFPFGVRGLISEDDGVSWNRDKEIIFADDAENQDCGYPSVVRLPSGDVLVLYYAVGSHRFPELGTHCVAIRVKEGRL